MSEPSLTPERLEWLRKVHYDRVPTCDECMLLNELDARDRQLAELREAIRDYSIYAKSHGAAPFGATEAEAALLPPTAKGEQP